MCVCVCVCVTCIGQQDSHPSQSAHADYRVMKQREKLGGTVVRAHSYCLEKEQKRRGREEEEKRTGEKRNKMRGLW